MRFMRYKISVPRKASIRFICHNSKAAALDESVLDCRWFIELVPVSEAETTIFSSTLEL